KGNFNGVINLSLRAATILLKFALSIVLIKGLGVDQYGVFGLFQSSIIILTFVIGFDFYTFSAREILNDEPAKRNLYLKNQLVFHLIGYLLIIPIAFALSKFEIVPNKFIKYFIVILVFEHLSQELYRLLILFGKTIISTIVLFFRSGIWVALLLSITQFSEHKISIKLVLILWSIGAFISVFIGFKYLDFKWIKGVDFKWIKKGILISIPFLIGTIFYKVVEFSGRYFLKFYFSNEAVGVFTFFSSIANILFVFVQTLVIIELYPVLVESKKSGFENFKKVFINFKKKVYKTTLIGLLFSIIGIYPLLVFLDKLELFENIASFGFLLASTFFFCLSFIYHYALYTFNRDIYILQAAGLTLFCNIVLSFILVPKYGIVGASIAQLSSFICMYYSKMYFWKNYIKRI
ncbi:unnamed protein product, partial [Ectocarpus sp. 12 AP-2014]